MRGSPLWTTSSVISVFFCAQYDLSLHLDPVNKLSTRQSNTTYAGRNAPGVTRKCNVAVEPRCRTMVRRRPCMRAARSVVHL
jgi:hypothetical protein